MVKKNMTSKIIWDNSKLKELEDLWKQGHSISKIGEMLGVSRNSVAGKAHRMGLPKRTSPISSKKEKLSDHKNHEINDKNIPDFLGKEITGLSTVVELLELKGRSKFEFPVESIISI